MVRSRKNARLLFPSFPGPYPASPEGGSTQTVGTAAIIKPLSLSSAASAPMDPKVDGLEEIHNSISDIDKMSQSRDELPTVEKSKPHIHSSTAAGAPSHEADATFSHTPNRVSELESELCNGSDLVPPSDPPADSFSSFTRTTALRSPLKTNISHLSNRIEPPPLLDLGALRTVPVELTERQARKQKFEHFNKICSEITEYLFLASDAVAQNREMLREAGITHVLNCAGGDCADHYPQQFQYRTLFLTDHVYEDISCYFYDVIEFVDSARSSHGKVLVHCYQGVSRSSAMVIAYLMWTTSKTYDEVYDMVKQRRGVCNPNPGFVCQLLQWRKRYMDRTHLSPHLYCISPVQIAPGSLTIVNGLRRFPSPSAVSSTCKEVPEPNWPTTLDTRGCFLLLAPSPPAAYIWCGSRCPQPLVDYATLTVVPRLQRYEHAPFTVTLVAEGEEPPQFWAALGGPLPVPSTNPSYSAPPTAEQTALPRSQSLTATSTLCSLRPVDHPLALASPTTLALSLDFIPSVPEHRERPSPTGSPGQHTPRSQSFSSPTVKPFLSRLPLALSPLTSRNTAAASPLKSLDTSSAARRQSTGSQAWSPEPAAKASLGDVPCIGTAQAVGNSHGTASTSHLNSSRAEREREREREVSLKRKSGAGEPKLYEWPSWEQLDMFDSDDLCDLGVYCLYSGSSASAARSLPSIHVWIGREFNVPGCGEGERAAEDARVKFGEQVGRQLACKMGLVKVVNNQAQNQEQVTICVELQGRERPEFWDSFENG